MSASRTEKPESKPTKPRAAKAPARKLVDLPLEKIDAKGGTQTRGGLNEATVKAYMEALRDGVQFPEPVVYEQNDHRWLSDGFHRIEAMKRIGYRKATVELRPGNDRDAILNGIEANARHGLPRTDEDKDRQIGILLKDLEWSKWSDREIARRCHVGHPRVAKARAVLKVSGTAVPDTRIVTRGGTTYEIDTSAIAAANKDRVVPASKGSIRTTADGAQDEPPDDVPDVQTDPPMDGDPAFERELDDKDPAAPEPDQDARDAAAVEAFEREVVAAFVPDLARPDSGIAQSIQQLAEGSTAPAPLVDAEGNSVPAHLLRAWELLCSGSDAIARHLQAAMSEWTRLEHAVTEYAGELAKDGANPTPEELLERCRAAGLPVLAIKELSGEFSGLGTKTVQHLAYRVRELAPMVVCDGCEGKGGPAVRKACCTYGWHSRVGSKQRQEKIERHGGEIPDESFIEHGEA